MTTRTFRPYDPKALWGQETGTGYFSPFTIQAQLRERRSLAREK